MPRSAHADHPNPSTPPAQRTAPRGSDTCDRTRYPRGPGAPASPIRSPPRSSRAAARGATEDALRRVELLRAATLHGVACTPSTPTREAHPLREATLTPSHLAWDDWRVRPHRGAWPATSPVGQLRHASDIVYYGSRALPTAAADAAPRPARIPLRSPGAKKGVGFETSASSARVGGKVVQDVPRAVGRVPSGASPLAFLCSPRGGSCEEEAAVFTEIACSGRVRPQGPTPQVDSAAEDEGEGQLKCDARAPATRSDSPRSFTAELRSPDITPAAVHMSTGASAAMKATWGSSTTTDDAPVSAVSTTLSGASSAAPSQSVAAAPSEMASGNFAHDSLLCSASTSTSSSTATHVFAAENHSAGTSLSVVHDFVPRSLAEHISALVTHEVGTAMAACQARLHSMDESIRPFCDHAPVVRGAVESRRHISNGAADTTAAGRGCPPAAPPASPHRAHVAVPPSSPGSLGGPESMRSSDVEGELVQVRPPSLSPTAARDHAPSRGEAEACTTGAEEYDVISLGSTASAAARSSSDSAGAVLRAASATHVPAVEGPVPTLLRFPHHRRTPSTGVRGEGKASGTPTTQHKSGTRAPAAHATSPASETTGGLEQAVLAPPPPPSEESPSTAAAVDASWTSISAVSGAALVFHAAAASVPASALGSLCVSADSAQEARMRSSAPPPGVRAGATAPAARAPVAAATRSSIRPEHAAAVNMAGEGGGREVRRVPPTACCEARALQPQTINSGVVASRAVPSALASVSVSCLDGVSASLPSVAVLGDRHDVYGDAATALQRLVAQSSAPETPQEPTGEGVEDDAGGVMEPAVGNTSAPAYNPLAVPLTVPRPLPDAGRPAASVGGMADATESAGVAPRDPHQQGSADAATATEPPTEYTQAVSADGTRAHLLCPNDPFISSISAVSSESSPQRLTAVRTRAQRWPCGTLPHGDNAGNNARAASPPRARVVLSERVWSHHAAAAVADARDVRLSPVQWSHHVPRETPESPAPVELRCVSWSDCIAEGHRLPEAADVVLCPHTSSQAVLPPTPPALRGCASTLVVLPIAAAGPDVTSQSTQTPHARLSHSSAQAQPDVAVAPTQTQRRAYASAASQVEQMVSVSATQTVSAGTQDAGCEARAEYASQTAQTEDAVHAEAGCQVVPDAAWCSTQTETQRVAESWCQWEYDVRDGAVQTAAKAVEHRGCQSDIAEVCAVEVQTHAMEFRETGCQVQDPVEPVATRAERIDVAQPTEVCTAGHLPAGAVERAATGPDVGRTRWRSPSPPASIVRARQLLDAYAAAQATQSARAAQAGEPHEPPPSRPQERQRDEPSPTAAPEVTGLHIIEKLIDHLTSVASTRTTAAPDPLARRLDADFTPAADPPGCADDVHTRGHVPVAASPLVSPSAPPDHPLQGSAVGLGPVHAPFVSQTHIAPILGSPRATLPPAPGVGAAAGVVPTPLVAGVPLCPAQPVPAVSAVTSLSFDGRSVGSAVVCPSASPGVPGGIPGDSGLCVALPPLCSYAPAHPPNTAMSWWPPSVAGGPPAAPHAQSRAWTPTLTPQTPAHAPQLQDPPGTAADMVRMSNASGFASHAASPAANAAGCPGSASGRRRGGAGDGAPQQRMRAAKFWTTSSVAATPERGRAHEGTPPATCTPRGVRRGCGGRASPYMSPTLRECVGGGDGQQGAAVLRELPTAQLHVSSRGGLERRREGHAAAAVDVGAAMPRDWVARCGATLSAFSRVQQQQQPEGNQPGAAGSDVSDAVGTQPRSPSGCGPPSPVSTLAAAQRDGGPTHVPHLSSLMRLRGVAPPLQWSAGASRGVTLSRDACRGTAAAEAGAADGHILMGTLGCGMAGGGRSTWTVRLNLNSRGSRDVLFGVTATPCGPTYFYRGDGCKIADDGDTGQHGSRYGMVLPAGASVLTCELDHAGRTIAFGVHPDPPRVAFVVPPRLRALMYPMVVLGAVGDAAEIMQSSIVQTGAQ